MKIERGWAFPDADEFMVSELSPEGTYQASHLRIALGHVHDWSAAIDGGAHIGTWSRLMSARFARVLAFEPHPDTFEALGANMTTFACANVEIRQAALGATPGAITLTLDDRARQMKNTGAYYVRDQQDGTIPRITIDSLALPSLGFLKLDVEGSEPLALMGARATLQRCRPVVLFENKNLWRRYGMKPDAVQVILRQVGYWRLCPAGTDEVWGPM